MAEPPVRTETSDGVGTPAGELHRGGRIGKYEILTQLSLGGMAELFLAFTSGPGGFRKYVVVKRILPDVRGQDQFVKMFLDEARITAALNHPNIGQVFELGDEEGLYLSMEFISGQNLNQVTSACVRRSQPVPVGFACAVARDVCLALHYAHAFTDPAGRKSPVIHRDVAQKNVMVTYEGLVKLLDFGIAKVKGSLGRTRVGMVKGTTGYMSPEQVRAEELDGRSDLFSVGVMLHELLTGHRLFSAPTELEEMTKILEAPIPKPSQLAPMIPEAISEVVMKALARERADRFATGKDLARALERAAGNLLFDPDRTSAFMRELFARKMEATRALLESAAGAGNVDEVLSSASRAIREDSGSELPGNAAKRKVAEKAAPPVEPSQRAPEKPVAPQRTGAPMGRTPLDTAETAQRLELDAAVDRAGLKTDPYGGYKIAALAVGGILLCWAVLHFASPADEQLGPPPVQVVMPLFVDKKSTGVPPISDKKATSSPQSSPQAVAEPQRVESTPAESVARRGRGTLTLVTLPPARVFLNGKELGKTPLFKHELPAKTHLLRLVGADGKTRVLSSPIKAGKNTLFKLNLGDLPEG